MGKKSRNRNKQLNREALSFGMELGGIAQELEEISVATYSGTKARSIITYGVIYIGSWCDVFEEYVQSLSSDELDIAKRVSRLGGKGKNMRDQLAHPIENTRRYLTKDLLRKSKVPPVRFTHSGLLVVPSGSEEWSNEHYSLKYCEDIPVGDFALISGSVVVLLRNELIPLMKHACKHMLKYAQQEMYGQSKKK